MSTTLTSKPQIIFVNRYFYPDHSATSQILSDLAFHLASQGKSVSVVTSRQTYDDANANLATYELARNVQIYRLQTTRFGRSGLAGRALDYVSFYTSVWRFLNRTAQSGDILVVKTDPPLLSILGNFIRKRKQLRLVNWLQDLYPEIAHKLRVPFVHRPAVWLLIFLRNWSLRQADANVVLGARMADGVLLAGTAKDRVHIITNWVNDHLIRPVAHCENPLVEEWDLEDKFVVGYSGNLGRAHEFNTILQAAEQLSNNRHIVFLFVGGGRLTNDLRARVESLGLSQLFRFLPYQPEHMLKYSLSLPHVHWLSLRPELEGFVFPSKFYGIAAAGRPIIAITSPNGDIATLVERHQCGLVVTPGDSTRLAEAVTLLATQPDACHEMGLRARKMLEAEFSRSAALTLWSDLLTSLIV